MTATKKQKNRKLVGTGLLAALASSACCIVPAISVIAGISGFASAFSWLEPARPFLAGIALLSLGYAWFNKLRQKRYSNQSVSCENCEVSRSSFFKSTGFLAAITVFALLMISFPYYSGTLLYGQGSAQTSQSLEKNEKATVYGVEGMTCQGCEKSIEKSLEQLKQVKSANASYHKGSVRIHCKKEPCSRSKVQEAIQKAGYQLTTKQ